MTFKVFCGAQTAAHRRDVPAYKHRAAGPHRATVNPPGHPWGTRPQRRFQSGSQKCWEGRCRTKNTLERRSSLHLPQGFYGASGKQSPSPCVQPRALGRGTTIPFSLGESLSSTPAQSGGQCRYKGLFCSGADARERGERPARLSWSWGTGR